MSIPWIRASSWRTYSPQEVIYIDYILYTARHISSQVSMARSIRSPHPTFFSALFAGVQSVQRSATLCRTACGTRDLRWGLPRLLMRQSIFRYAPEWGRMDRSTGHNRSIFEHVWTLNMSNRFFVETSQFRRLNLAGRNAEQPYSVSIFRGLKSC